MNSRLHRFVVSFVFFMMVPALAQGATYYVAKTGSNSNSCSQAQSPGTPKLTIVAGIACMAGGDTLIIGDGTYNEQIGAGDGGGSSPIPSGSPGAPTVIKAQNRNMAIVAPNMPSKYYVIEIKDRSYITIDGLVADARYIQSYPYLAHGSNSTTTHHIIFKNGTARNGQGDFATGIAFGDPNSKVADCQVLNMDSHNNGLPSYISLGITLGGINCIIDGNRTYNNGSYGIQVYRNATGNIIRNNRIYNNANRGFIFALSETETTGTVNNHFYNNILYNNGRGIEADNRGTRNNHIYNNTIYGNAGTCIWLYGGSSSVVKNNICYANAVDAVVQEGGTAVSTNNLTGTNPLFANPSSGDFHLKSGSPGIGMGADLSAIFSTDAEGNVRPAGAWDAGAYRYGTGSTSSSGQPAPPSNLRVVSP